MRHIQVDRDQLYEEAAATFGPALDRLVRAYEADSGQRGDLAQEIHLALWRSLEGFDGRCSLRTWVYRVAHNTATSYVLRQRRQRRTTYVGLEELEALPDARSAEPDMDHARRLEALTALIQSLKPFDRQVILSYLEGLDAAAISEFTGLSPGNVATKIHRIKNILASRFQEGATRGQ